uniref:LAGLIDADG endonuclease n=1 Tax=Bipolaris cookei TaxID=74410 RepID=A0A2H4NRV1_9PLEO|nr:LAGLIDADG endonuclease [Bipolaris cookei]ATV95722.1 LAGLIDADG endonuclease [Bipolaris cookei]
MNIGLSDVVHKYFPDVVPAVRPVFKDISIKEPHWLAGFTSGEGCFMVRIRKSSNENNLPKLEFIFQVTQHVRDRDLIESFITYLSCGHLRERKGGSAVDFFVYKTSDLNSKIIPFFEKYPVLGAKSRDYQDFLSIISLKNNSSHLTPEGMEQIKEIQSRMNTKRID